MIENPIKVGLHGHGLPDFKPWWKARLGYAPEENTAKIIIDAAVNAGIGIYTITDDEFGRERDKSRFQQVRESAEKLTNPDNPRYQYASAGKNAFRIRKGDDEILFLDGQSLEVLDLDGISGDLRKYELLTFGRSGISGGNSFRDTFSYLDGEGLPSIAEHPLAHGHHGPMDIFLYENLCRGGEFTAVEHNAKVAVPNWLGWIPHPMINGHIRRKNYAAAQVAKEHGVPVIANDDADFPSQIGRAYTIFPGDNISMIDGDSVKDSLVNLIREGNFETHRGDIGGIGFFKYCARIAESQLAEKLESKPIYDEAHSPTVY